MNRILLTGFICFLFTKSVNVSGFEVGSLVYPFFAGLDPDRVFVELMVHHSWQALLAWVSIFVWRRRYGLEWQSFGFTTKGLAAAFPYVLRFLAAWALLQFVVSWLWVYALQWEFTFPYAPTQSNVLGKTCFQLFFSGPSEELLYRALNLTVLLQVARSTWPQRLPLGTTLAVGLSVIIFMGDHINFILTPVPHITHLNLLQLATCLVFGLFYAWLFLRFRTIFAPMLAHSLLNVVIELSGAVIFWTYPHLG
jgi:uncharacterized protein